MSLLNRKVIPQLDQAVLNGVRWHGLPKRVSHIHATLMYINGNYDHRDFRTHWATWTERQQEEARRILLDVNNNYWVNQHRKLSEVNS